MFLHNKKLMKLIIDKYGNDIYNKDMFNKVKNINITKNRLN